MAYLATNPTNVVDGGTLELDGVSSVTSADVGGVTYIFVAGGVDDGISVFRLNANGTLTPVFDLTDGGTLELDGARGLSTTTIDGNTYLFAAGFDDNGVSVFRVNTNGSLTAVADVNDDAILKLTGAADTASVRVGTSTYLFVAGQTDDGISSFRVAGDGRLTSIANTADSGTVFLDGVRALSTVTVGGTAYLIAGGSVDNGISVFSVSAAGALTAVTNLADNATLRLAGVSDITTTVIGGTTYVYVSGATDSGVSVFTLSAAGVLTNIDNEVDSASTLIAGATSIAVHNIGATSYLMVGSASENGLSLYRIENGSNNSTAGTLTFVENIADSGSRTLGGAVAVHGATVGGSSYFIGGGQTDDGVSTFGATTTGQIFYGTEGNLADARIAFLNTDGSNPTVLFDNNPSTDLITGFVESVVVDSAAGLFFAIVTGNEGINARIVMGRIGSATPPTVVFTFDPTFAGTENNLAFNLEIDPISHKLYVGYIEFAPTFDPTTQGIRQFDYNTTTGAVTGGTFFVRDSTALTPPSTAGADGLFASQDFEIDATHNVAYSQSLALGDGFETNAILRFSLSNPGGAAGVSVINQSQFTLSDPGTGVITTSNGIIADIEIDRDSDRLYFLTRSVQVNEAGGNDSIWVVANASTAVNATPTKLTLVGIVASDFYPQDMTLDEVNNILYVESENSNLVGGGVTDVILVFQLNAAGTTATLINTLPMNFTTTANIEAMNFQYLATLSGVTATGTAAGEQGVAVDLLSAPPTIADFDGDRLSSATVQITGGSFTSNEASSADDALGYSSAMTQSGLIAGTNITVSWNAATGTLTLTGYDTFANYRNALDNIFFRSTGDNPTNYGLNTTRTITWTISDGLLNVPGGAVNSATTSISITAVNDAPVNTVGAALPATEDATVNVTGMSVNDPDANPALTNLTVTFTVTKGTITLLTNVADGLTGASITGNGTASITVTAPQNLINATLAATGGLTYTPTANVNGTDTLTMVTSDGGSTGSGGTLSDTDVRTINIAAVNDAPIASSSAAATQILEDSTPAGQTVSALFGGASNYSDATDQVTGGSSADAFAGVIITDNVATPASGVWQYSTNGGTSWTNITTGVTAATGFALAATTLVRFLPALNFNGIAPTMSATLVDASGGALTSGATVNASVTGGTTRFSSASVLLSQGVTAVNDAPTLTNLQGDSVTTTEPAGAGSVMPNVKIDVGGNATIADVDNLNFNGGLLRFSFISGLVATEDQLNFDTSAATTVTTSGANLLVGGTVVGTFIGGGAGGGLLEVSLNGNATPALVQTLIRAVNYTNTGGDNPTAGARTIFVLLNDGSGTANGGSSTVAASMTVTVVAVDDAAVAGADNNSVLENATIVGASVLGNDSDVDGPALSVGAVNGVAGNVGTQITLASGALVTLRANGTYDYNPNGAFNYLIDAATAAATSASNTSATDSFTYTLTGGGTATVTVTVNGVAGAGDELRGTPGVDFINGTAGDDIIVLLDGDDRARGFGGNDTIFGGLGYDQIGGGDGNDTLDGGAGVANELGGGPGNDAYVARALGDTITELLNEGTDLVQSYVNVLTLSANVENLTFLGTGNFVGVGNGLDNVITGGAGADSLAGGGGNDTLIGGSGAANELQGGAGDDIYVVSVAGDSIVETLGGGIDTVQTAVGAYVLPTNVENLTYTGVGGFAGVGNALDNTITHTTGTASELTGLGGNDTYVVTVAGDTIIEAAAGGTDTVQTTLTNYTLANNVENLTFTGGGVHNGVGNTGDNVITGGALADALSGLNGNDTLIGGNGADLLIGGAGADIFRYLGGETGLDRILDFTSGSDKISLSAAFYTVTGTLTFESGTSPFATTANSTFLYDSSTGILSYDADGNGAGAAVQIAQLNAGLPLSVNDFVIV
jgi:Ca2+-binding RTX toxin-like protein/6-phosphogluconolactonase (cycloisomerase 2 family)